MSPRAAPWAQRPPRTRQALGGRPFSGSRLPATLRRQAPRGALRAHAKGTSWPGKRRCQQQWRGSPARTGRGPGRKAHRPRPAQHALGPSVRSRSRGVRPPLAGLFARRPPTCQMPPCVLGNYSCLRSVKKMPALWRLGAPDILPDRNRFAEGLKTHAPRGPTQAPIRGNRNWSDRELDN